MILLAPLVLAGPLLVLAQAVVLLVDRGPLGVAAAVLLVLGVAWSTRWCWRRARTWWASTKAPVRTVRSPARPRPVPPRRR